MFSLNNKLAFPLFEGKMAIAFDKYFLIFGNGEIRLKHGEDKVFSNIGVNNGFYNANGAKSNEMLGEGAERLVGLETYEIYHVVFE